MTAHFLADIDQELTFARKRFPPINNVHEGYAVILEELEEFWEEAKKKPAERSSEKLRRELVQVAAMAARTATDLAL